MHALATVAPTTASRPTAVRGRPQHSHAVPLGAVAAPTTQPVGLPVTRAVAGGTLTGSAGTPAPDRPGHDVAQGGFLDDLLGTAVPGLLGAASSALSGDSAGALGAVRSTGAAAAPLLAQQGASALGGMIGGGAGQFVSSLGAPVGQGLSSVVSGESTPGQAAGGLLSSLTPQLLTMLMSLLQR